MKPTYVHMRILYLFEHGGRNGEPLKSRLNGGQVWARVGPTDIGAVHNALWDLLRAGVLMSHTRWWLHPDPTPEAQKLMERLRKIKDPNPPHGFYR